MKPASTGFTGGKMGKNTKATRDTKAQKINANGNAQNTKIKNYNTQKIKITKL